MKLLVSACLLGVPCRYDGASKGCPAVMALGEWHQLIPICPEEAGGLPTPRPPAERQGERVVTCQGRDVTAEYTRGAALALETARKEGAAWAILKERSPSCGAGEIYDGTFTRTLIPGDGVTAALLQANGIAVLGESQLHRLPEGD